MKKYSGSLFFLEALGEALAGGDLVFGSVVFLSSVLSLLELATTPDLSPFSANNLFLFFLSELDEDLSAVFLVEELLAVLLEEALLAESSLLFSLFPAFLSSFDELPAAAD